MRLNRRLGAVLAAGALALGLAQPAQAAGGIVYDRVWSCKIDKPTGPDIRVEAHTVWEIFPGGYVDYLGITVRPTLILPGVRDPKTTVDKLYVAYRWDIPPKQFSATLKESPQYGWTLSNKQVQRDDLDHDPYVRFIADDGGQTCQINIYSPGVF
jgi:hypothetical protein